MELKLAGDHRSDESIPQEDLNKDPAYLKRKDVKTPQVNPIAGRFLNPRDVIHQLTPHCHNKVNQDFMAKKILNPNTPDVIPHFNKEPVMPISKPEPLPWDQRTELIMLGTGPTNKQCPYDAEVWTINDAFQSLETPRCDKLFFFDKMFMDFPFPIGRRSAEIIQSLRSQGIQVTPEIAQKYGIQARQITPHILNTELPNTEIVSIWMCPDIKNFRILPLWDLIAEWDTDFFTNSFAYMISYALWLGKYKKLKFYGVDMTNEHEIYRNERGCVEFWIGIARGMGLEIEISKGSYICKRELYGLETN